MTSSSPSSEAEAGQRVTDAGDPLLARSQAGDRAAFGELVRRHERPVRAYLARLLGDLHAADDVAQEVFMESFRGLDRYRGEGEFRSWLLATAHHKAVSLLRSRARRRTEPVADVEATLASDPDEQEQLGRALARCLEKLPEKSRHLVDRHYTAGQSAEAIARSLGRKGSAVRMALLRIRTALADCVERRLAKTGAIT
jgi:RNA polymerase sigma-70 factor (ECF subfamily)